MNIFQVQPDMNVNPIPHPAHSPTLPGWAQPCGILLVVALLVLMGGCTLFGQSQTPAKQSYLLQSEGTSGASAAEQARPCLTLRVSMPSSAPGVGTTLMAYTTEPPRLDYFAYHKWVDTPARMIAALIEKRLDSSALFGAVVTGSSDIRTDLRLDAEIKSLQQDFSGAKSTLGLVIKISLVEVSSRSLLRSETFSYAETVNGGNAEAGVAAANRAADQFLADLTLFVAESISGFDCPPSGS